MLELKNKFFFFSFNNNKNNSKKKNYINISLNKFIYTII